MGLRYAHMMGNSTKKPFYSATRLGARFCYAPAHEVNAALADLGMQEPTNDSSCRWRPTAKGRPLCRYEMSKKPGDTTKWLMWASDIVPILAAYFERPSMEHVRALRIELDTLKEVVRQLRLRVEYPPKG